MQILVESTVDSDDSAPTSTAQAPPQIDAAKIQVSFAQPVGGSVQMGPGTPVPIVHMQPNQMSPPIHQV